ncbi:MAG: hypothetical protein ACOCRX_09315 [Candidatus Woesearchaeota archaeon]
MSFFLDNYSELKSQKEMDEFLNIVGGFHDGLIKELHSLNSAFVDENLSMACSFKYDLRILVQRQWENPSAVELILGNVIKINIEKPSYIGSSSGEISYNKRNEKRKIKLSLDNNYFVCRKFYWRDASEWMGKNSRFGDYLSLDSIYPYKKLEDGWVMCENCCNAWKPGESTVVQCPRCSGLNYTGISKKPDVLE